MSASLAAAITLLLRPAVPTAGRIAPPALDEYAEYYGRYIRRVPAGDLGDLLRRQAEEVATALGALTPAQAAFAYADGKWTVKQVLGHVNDMERLFAYRATSIGRGDPAALPGCDQDQWMAGVDFNAQPLPALVAEFLAVRAATIALVEGLTAEASVRRGTASGNPFTPRALLYGLQGHADYHLERLRADYFASPRWPK